MADAIAVRASAPGKSLLSGGYAVLDPKNSGYAVTMTAYSHARVTTNNSNSLQIGAPQFDIDYSGNIDPKTGQIAFGEVSKEARLVAISVEIATKYLTGIGVEVPGMRVETENDPAFNYRFADVAGEKHVSKSGLGSSAAVTVATVGAIVTPYLSHLNDFERRHIIHKLSQIAHGIATGKVGSGFDIASVTFGSIEYQRFPAELISGLDEKVTPFKLVRAVKREWNYLAIPFSMPVAVETRTADFVGEAMITTKAVGSVSEFQKAEPEIHAKLMAEIESGTQITMQALRSIRRDLTISRRIEESRFADLVQGIDIGRAASKKLGQLSGVDIEPDDCTELIEELKANGALTAKLPGAGGKDNIMVLIRGGNNIGKSKIENLIESRPDLELKRGISGRAPLVVSNNGLMIRKVVYA